MQNAKYIDLWVSKYIYYYKMKCSFLIWLPAFPGPSFLAPSSSMTLIFPVQGFHSLFCTLPCIIQCFPIIVSWAAYTYLLFTARDISSINFFFRLQDIVFSLFDANQLVKVSTAIFERAPIFLLLHKVEFDILKVGFWPALLHLSHEWSWGVHVNIQFSQKNDFRKHWETRLDPMVVVLINVSNGRKYYTITLYKSQ